MVERGVSKRGDSDQERAELARAIWRDTRPAPGSIVGDYLFGRGLSGRIPACIRFHPALKHPSGSYFPAMVAAVKVLTIKAANRERDAEEWCEEHIPIGRTTIRDVSRAAHKVVAMADVWKVLRTWENVGGGSLLDSEGKRGPKGKDVAR